MLFGSNVWKQLTLFLWSYIPAKLSITDCIQFFYYYYDIVHQFTLFVTCLVGKYIFLLTYFVLLLTCLAGLGVSSACGLVLCGGWLEANSLQLGWPACRGAQPGSQATPHQAQPQVCAKAQVRIDIYVYKQCGTPWALREITNSIVGPLPQQSDELPHHLFRIQVGYGSALIYMISLRTR